MSRTLSEDRPEPFFHVDMKGYHPQMATLMVRLQLPATGVPELAFQGVVTGTRRRDKISKVAKVFKQQEGQAVLFGASVEHGTNPHVHQTRDPRIQLSMYIGDIGTNKESIEEIKRDLSMKCLDNKASHRKITKWRNEKRLLPSQREHTPNGFCDHCNV
jgi:hypothetical protein